MIRWHRAGFQAYWRWKIKTAQWPSKDPGGDPSARTFARSVSPTHYGAHHGFMASFSSSASMSDKPPLQSIWRGEGDRRPKGGRRSFIITPTASHDRWTYSWPRQSSFLTALRVADSATRSPPNPVAGSDRCHPTAEWISAATHRGFHGWKVAPQYIIRDRDAVYGDVFIRRLRAMSAFGIGQPLAAISVAERIL